MSQSSSSQSSGYESNCVHGAYVLDTSAILAFYQDEPGADVVEGIFCARERGQAVIFVSYLTVYELIYLAMFRRGCEEACSFLIELRNLEMEEIWPDEDLLWEAAQIKSQGGLSVADSFVAATALQKNAVLVHKDLEFQRLEGKIRMQSL